MCSYYDFVSSMCMQISFLWFHIYLHSNAFHVGRLILVYIIYFSFLFLFLFKGAESQISLGLFTQPERILNPSSGIFPASQWRIPWGFWWSAHLLPIHHKEPNIKKTKQVVSSWLWVEHQNAPYPCSTLSQSQFHLSMQASCPRPGFMEGLTWTCHTCFMAWVTSDWDSPKPQVFLF